MFFDIEFDVPLMQSSKIKKPKNRMNSAMTVIINVVQIAANNSKQQPPSPGSI